MKRHFDHPAFDALVSSWELELEVQAKSERTVANYVEAMDLFCRWLEQEHPGATPGDVTADMCRTWIGHLVATRSASTGRTRWVALRQFFAWAAAEDEIPTNPMELVKQPAVVDPEVEVLTDPQVRALLATCNGTTLLERRDQAIIMMFIDTGMRVSALAGAELPDLDLHERVVVVLEKGRKEIVKPFGVKTARALDRYLRARARWVHGDASKALFVSARDGSAMNRNTVHQMLKRRGAEAGIPGLHPHMFRHTFSDRWLRAGGAEGDLMELNGWTSREMIGRYAKRTRAERAREAHRRLSPMDNLE